MSETEARLAIHEWIQRYPERACAWNHQGPCEAYAGGDLVLLNVYDRSASFPHAILGQFCLEHLAQLRELLELEDV